MMFKEPIAIALKVAGTDLNFTSFYIKGIPSADVYLLHGGEASVYHVERRNFQFRISAQDVADNTITTNSSFYTEDGTYQYYFSVEEVRLDTTGWADLIVIFNKSVLA